MVSHSVHEPEQALKSGSGAPATKIKNLKCEKYWIQGGGHPVASDKTNRCNKNLIDF